ncbi:Sb-PDE family phosphodiesterase [Sphingopyxis sp. R3-92]|uniref:Sb-PDE family phosphodiesterase n=1 Tax=Sphingopyxis sp. R3-92 TaxID=3158553 RepID=UPI003EE4EB50
MHFKKKLAGMLFAGCAFLGLASVSHAQEPKEIDFPVTPDGQQVLAVDTHTHSLFSDGAVWPNVRVSEAVSSGLDMLAITEHIDYQPKFKDLPNLDRNRAFVVARDAATGGSSGLLVVNGVEIAQPDASLGTFSGHFNAIFLNDANKLLLPTPKNQPPRVDWRKAIRAAKEQGAIMIWNHSWWDQGQTKPQPFHRELMQEKLIDGLEVANAAQYSPSAFQFALDHDLAIVGGSDLHSTMQSFFEYSGIEQRTSTLVLADDKSEAAIKKGFQARRTVALYNHTLIGRERDVRSIVEGALTIEVRSVAHPGDPFGFGKLAIRNAASSPFTLRRVGADMIMDAGPMVTVPARGEIVLTFKSGAEGQSASMDFDVLNAQIAPHTPLRMTLRSK